MAGSMRTHTKGYYSSFILILLFSLTLFSCELFAPPQDIPEETEQEEIEEIPKHPIFGYWVRSDEPDVVFKFTGSINDDNIFYGNRVVIIVSGKYAGESYVATIEIHDDIIKVWTGARYRMPPSYEYQIVISGDTMLWYKKYTTTLVSTFTRTEEVVEPWTIL